MNMSRWSEQEVTGTGPQGPNQNEIFYHLQLKRWGTYRVTSFHHTGLQINIYCILFTFSHNSKLHGVVLLFPNRTELFYTILWRHHTVHSLFYFVGKSCDAPMNKWLTPRSLRRSGLGGAICAVVTSHTHLLLQEIVTSDITGPSLPSPFFRF